MLWRNALVFSAVNEAPRRDRSFTRFYPEFELLLKFCRCGNSFVWKKQSNPTDVRVFPTTAANGVPRNVRSTNPCMAPQRGSCSVSRQWRRGSLLRYQNYLDGFSVYLKKKFYFLVNEFLCIYLNPTNPDVCLTHPDTIITLFILQITIH